VCCSPCFFILFHCIHFHGVGWGHIHASFVSCVCTCCHTTSPAVLCVCLQCMCRGCQLVPDSLAPLPGCLQVCCAVLRCAYTCAESNRLGFGVPAAAVLPVRCHTHHMSVPRPGGRVSLHTQRGTPCLFATAAATTRKLLCEVLPTVCCCVLPWPVHVHACTCMQPSGHAQQLGVSHASQHVPRLACAAASTSATSVFSDKHTPAVGLFAL
jgi:hypothetical protein